MKNSFRLGKFRIKPRSIVLLIVVFVLISSALYYAISTNSITRLSIAGGFPVSTGMYGVNFPGTGIVQVGNSFPGSFSQQTGCVQYINTNIGVGVGISCQWQWNSINNANPEMQTTLSCFACIPQVVDVPYQIGAPIQYCSLPGVSGSSGQPCVPVSYYVSVPTSVSPSGFVHVDGNIVSYVITISVSTGSSSSPGSQYNGPQWINGFGTQVWNLAYTDPYNSAWQGNIFQSPLFLGIIGCTQSNGNNGIQNCGGVPNSQLQPMTVGSQITLYNNPQQTGSWSQLFGCSAQWQTQSGNACPQSVVNSSLVGGNIYSPSSQLINSAATPVYWSIGMTGFGAYSCGLLGASTCQQNVKLTLIMYTLLIGQFIVTNPFSSTLSQTSACYFNCGGGGGGGGISFTIILIGVVAVVLLIIVILAWYYSGPARMVAAIIPKLAGGGTPESTGITSRNISIE